MSILQLAQQTESRPWDFHEKYFKFLSNLQQALNFAGPLFGIPTICLLWCINASIKENLSSTEKIERHRKGEGLM